MSARTRTDLGWEIQYGDRIELIASAVDVIAILSRYKSGGDDDPWAPERELDADELAAYQSALNFIKKELGAGPRPTQSHMNRSVEVVEACDGELVVINGDDMEEDDQDGKEVIQ
jgi:bifunctional DNA-binding transcriptional regulator/antitoxin component of YhaV-PrlF toxin-antitoxin module